MWQDFLGTSNCSRARARIVLNQVLDRVAKKAGYPEYHFVAHLLLQSAYPKTLAETFGMLRIRLVNDADKQVFGKLNSYCKTLLPQRYIVDDLMTIRYCFYMLTEHMILHDNKHLYVDSKNCNTAAVDEVVANLGLTFDLLSKQHQAERECEYWEKLLHVDDPQLANYQADVASGLNDPVFVCNDLYICDKEPEETRIDSSKEDAEWFKLLKQLGKQGLPWASLTQQMRQRYPNFQFTCTIDTTSMYRWMIYFRSTSKPRKDAHAGIQFAVRYWLILLRQYPSLLQLPKALVQISNMQLLGKHWNNRPELAHWDTIVLRVTSFLNRSDLEACIAKLE